MTPLMKQYWEIKSLHPDKILLFRMGDFYEMFFDDAVRVAPLLGITLTQRNKKSQDETPMCGVPYHSIAGPINKLLSHGLRVAICDQVEDPKMAKGLVKRAITRILTPGMVYDPETLEGSESHYMMAWDHQYVSFVEPTTGECFYIEKDTRCWQQLVALPIAEIVKDPKQTLENLSWSTEPLVSDFQFEAGNVDLPESAQRLLAYVRTLTQGQILPLRSFEKRNWQAHLELSAATFRHLEIFTNSLGDKTGTFFSAVDRTLTSAGARELKEWIRFPLIDEKQIQKRWQQISFWKQNMPTLKRVRQLLQGMGDIERRLAKMAQPTGHPRDFLALAQSLERAKEVLTLNSDLQFNSQIETWVQKINNTLIEEPPLSLKQGGFIRQGVSRDLDELILLATNSQSLVQELEDREKQETQISSLKVRYNSVFGFYIEITHTHKDKVPAHYKRKQTLTNAERFYTDELLELEKKVLSAQHKRAEMELEYFEALKKVILQSGTVILEVARYCRQVDVLTSLTWLAVEQNYVQPEFSNEKFELIGSRHPVVEQSLKTPFVANDIHLSKEGCLLLTGPNMAGKSTLMRQIALSVILAQMGSYVPARSAVLPLLESIHTRIGSSDILSQGLSTFMVEMKETAELLQSAGKKSLVLLDEIGRGTSTYDGMSLAQAILEYLLSHVKPYSLFATHYHELTVLSEKWKQIQNVHMEVSDSKGEIRFLYTLCKGPALQSYGVHVAELAGLPPELIARARELLREKEHQKPAINRGSKASSVQLSLFENLPKNRPKDLQVLENLKGFDTSRATPLEALNWIFSQQKDLQQ